MTAAETKAVLARLDMTSTLTEYITLAIGNDTTYALLVITPERVQYT